jgi:ATP-dependent Lon protease
MATANDNTASPSAPTDAPLKDLRTVTGVPLLPLRDLVVLPGVTIPLLVGRERSVAAINAARLGNGEIFLAAQTRAADTDPGTDGIHAEGTLCRIAHLVKVSQSKLKISVEGLRRGRIVAFSSTEPGFAVDVETWADEKPMGPEVDAIERSLRAALEELAELNPQGIAELNPRLEGARDVTELADRIAAYAPMRLEGRQRYVAEPHPLRRLEALLESLEAEVETLRIEKRIRGRIKKQVEKNQKEYYLNERMQAIQKELGDQDEFKAELTEIAERIEKKQLSAEAKQRLERELKKLRSMNPMSAETTVIRNYVDWVLGLPWGETTEEAKDIAHAEAILDEDHFGLEKIKERIVEYLAVTHLTDAMKSPVLCFVGPPGVGKTSLARSIARATGRKFVRVSLGGVHDEAEIRGHRRTYIGALPGKVMQQLKKAGSDNPVFLLDEIDKMARDYRGDPAAALLEVLDPEQNAAFNDHYIDLDYDLSKVMFIATANSLSGIPIPLLDRLEVIQLSGYTEQEKTAIAQKYLLPKQREANGLKEIEVTVADALVSAMIRQYTREAGVRNLERAIGKLCRKIARDVLATGNRAPRVIDEAVVGQFLGVPKFKNDTRSDIAEVGIATGLAWTEFGGEVLLIEINLMPGRGKLTITGKLGDVMQESAQAAMSYARSRAQSLGLGAEFYSKLDIHIHVPEGAIPKDGPSAGITMATALVSALTGVPCRHDVAMTGEITLRGRVLPIGGLKEKALAAYRLGIHDVIIPDENARDIEDFPAVLRETIRFHPVTHMDQVLKIALADEPAREEFGYVDEVLRPKAAANVTSPALNDLSVVLDAH